MIKWRVEIRPDATKAIEKLDKVNQVRISKFLQRVVDNPIGPRAQAEALAGKYKGWWRYSVGDYRLICEIQDSVLTIFIVTVGHRSEIYH